MYKLIRVSTVPISLNILLKGQLEFLNQEFEVIGVSSQGDDLKETQLREGIKVVPLNMERGISPIKDLISLFKLYLLFKREKPQIVHSITPKAGLLSMLAAKFAGTPIRMHTFTGLIFPSKKGWFQKILIAMDKLLCWAATDIYPEGQGVKNDLIKYKITTKQLSILANGNVNGIDLGFYSKSSLQEEDLCRLKEQLGIDDSCFTFIFVGRLVGDKGINELIKAFKSIDLKNCRLLLVGPLESESDPIKEETLAEIENNLHIISVGFQKDVRPYFAISDALVFPSYREGFPNVVLQAGALELPCIVTNINGSNEIIKNKINGIIIPVKEIESLKSAMVDMVNDKQNYQIMKSNARNSIAADYDQKIVWNALLAEYKKLLSINYNV
ncbi:glycosyltransferase family 4 protein [Sphingobacterium siyangense]|uniref:glycosyltransferase family 4 protein n=1 Tax=Sphingobacterium siyangense TaxID=459529 RepID=UPI003017EA44